MKLGGNEALPVSRLMCAVVIVVTIPGTYSLQDLEEEV